MEPTPSPTTDAPTPPATARAPRRDAVRNRALLIATAAHAFRTEGLEVGVDQIARRAQVGVATLYRHFPTKSALVLAVLTERLEELAGERDEIIASAPADRALERFLLAAMRRFDEHRGLVDALARQPPAPELRERLRAQLVALLEPLVAHGRASGELRADVDAEDLRVVLRMLAAATRSEARAPERYLRLLLRGLRPGA